MGLKDLFNSKAKRYQAAKTPASASAMVESEQFVRVKNIEKNKFRPDIDFTTGSNWANYGSMKLYYQYAYKRIQDSYPYDGTLAERTAFANSSSYFDQYVFGTGMVLWSPY